MRSLRFRLPALFLAGIILAGLVAAFTAARLFQEVTRADSLDELRTQAAGLADLYAEQALQTAGEGRNAPRFAAARLERATGTTLYYAGLDLFPGPSRACGGSRPTSCRTRTRSRRTRRRPSSSSRPARTASTSRRAEPLEIGGQTFGFLVAAKPRAEIRERWQPLVERLGLAVLPGSRSRAGSSGTSRGG